MAVSIFHNPKCSKSRAALKLLNERGIEPGIVFYLKTPPSISELQDIVKNLDIEPKKLIRFKESTAVALGLSISDSRQDSEWIKLMVENPILIERPIVFNADQAVIGRPPENVLGLIRR